MPDPKSKLSLLRRTGRRIAILTLTTATIAAAGGAVILGTQELQARATQSKPEGSADLTPVRVSPLKIEQGYQIPRRFVGQLETAQSTDLGFEFAGLVAQVLVDEGDVVAKGDVIARLDIALLETEITRLSAARDALAAQRDFSDLSVQRRAALKIRGFTSAEAFDQARFTQTEMTARIAETNAAIRSIEIQIEKATLKAPFSGQIAARRADQGTTVSPGQPITTLLETARPEVRVGLPLSIQLPIGTEVDVDIAGQSYRAVLKSMRPDIDAQTRTQTAIFQLADGATATFGQTVSIQFVRDVAVRGVWVPVQALREGSKGLWTVLVVDQDQIIRPAAVEVLHAESSRAYVRGTFQDGALLVDGGTHRVTPGQTVRVIEGS
jgi:RND family efflux transporter MFP subunit